MGAEKFKTSKFDEEDIVPPNKDFKGKVNAILKGALEATETTDTATETTDTTAIDTTDTDTTDTDTDTTDTDTDTTDTDTTDTATTDTATDTEAETTETETTETEVKTEVVGLNLLDMEEQKEASKKSAMTIYFEEEDLMLLKAVSKLKKTTVNKTVKNILEATIKTTRANLPDGFDVVGMSKEKE